MADERVPWADGGSRQTGQVVARDYGNAPDAELIGWSAAGDRQAFDQIVIRHGQFALRVAARIISDRALVEDIVQQAMVRAWAQAGRFEPRRAQFTTWLYKIVINLCIDERRRQQPERIPEHFDAADPAAGPMETMAIDERQRTLTRLLQKLPARQRAAVTLVYEENMPGAEAARVLGVSAKAVERLLARARGNLRELLRSTSIGGLDDVNS